MPRWTIDQPADVELGDFAALRVRLVSGTVAILAAQDAPAIDVEALTGPPLVVTKEAGILTVGYDDLRWEGMLGWERMSGWEGMRGWLRQQHRSADFTLTIPPDCPIQLGVVNASTTVSGVSAGISAMSISGGLTLDGVTGTVKAKTVSGDLEARGLDGGIVFSSVSGDLTLADGSIERLDAKTVNGQVTADIGLADGSDIRVATVSGEVTVRLPADPSVRVELRSASGRVQTTFDGLQPAGSKPRPASATGTIGDGASRLSVSSVSGNVTLLGRAQAAAAPSAAASGGAR
jgi:hypothetical protein